MFNHSQRLETLETYIASHDMDRAKIALQLVQQIHTGFRKDGSTPNWDHPVSVALLAIEIYGPNEDAILVALLHDTPEDTGTHPAVLACLFGSYVGQCTGRLTKCFRGKDIDEEIVFAAISSDQLSAVIKALDRVHNLSTMNGAFSDDKKIEYIHESKNHIFPMLDAAFKDVISIVHIRTSAMLKNAMHINSPVFMKAV